MRFIASRIHVALTEREVASLAGRAGAGASWLRCGSLTIGELMTAIERLGLAVAPAVTPFRRPDAWGWLLLERSRWRPEVAFVAPALAETMLLHATAYVRRPSSAAWDRVVVGTLGHRVVSTSIGQLDAALSAPAVRAALAVADGGQLGPSLHGLAESVSGSCADVEAARYVR